MRGHRESMENRENRDNNPGNFIEFLREIANYSPELAEHMEKLASRNATLSQNELIGVIGINFIQNDLIDEIKKSGCFSIMADEVIASNEDIVSLCLRYVDSKDDIREVFIQFLDSEKNLDFLEAKGIPVEKCVGQCYDGAPNMQSEKKGVASYILAKAPQGGVTHCNSHNLNLVISTAAKLPIVDNTLEQLKAIQIFFNTSPKRESLLTHIVDKECFNSKRRVLLGMCKTRWSERDISYEHLYLAMPHMVDALQIMVGTHPDVATFLETYTTGWDSSRRCNISRNVYHWLGHRNKKGRYRVLKGPDRF